VVTPLGARLVLDWDGTVTEVDSLHMVLLEFGDVGVYEQAEDDLGGNMTLHEVIGLEFSTVRAPLEQVASWLVENVSIRPGFHDLVERFQPLVVSSGFHELIEPVLAREGIQVDLRANRLDPRPDGWRVRWRDETICPVCGESCKRALVASIGPFVYVGDGYSDRCVALAAERVFARDGLAAYLDEQRVAYESFEGLSDVAASLGHAASASSRLPRAHSDG
jgi:2-hydroxy-3-keto-5-methylthiopentenyl-1-phosphate phosphatase